VFTFLANNGVILHRLGIYLGDCLMEAGILLMVYSFKHFEIELVLPWRANVKF
jgi:hypothetical protein